MFYGRLHCIAFIYSRKTPVVKRQALNILTYPYDVFMCYKTYKQNQPLMFSCILVLVWSLQSTRKLRKASMFHKEDWMNQSSLLLWWGSTAIIHVLSWTDDIRS